MKKIFKLEEIGPGLCRPRVFVIMGLVFLSFVAAVFVTSALFDTPFVAPRERISMAIGIHYLYPFLIGVTGYVSLQAVTQLLGVARYSMQDRLKHVVADAFFLGLFASVIYFHFNVKMWMPLINPNTYDGLFFRIDQALPHVMAVFFAAHKALAFISPLSIDNFYQIGFLAMFAFSLWSHAIGDRRWHFHSMCALLLLEMMGAFSYLLMPAAGPFVFEAGLNLEATKSQGNMLAAFRMVQSEGAAWLREHGEGYFTGPPAAMPSLHVAGALIMSWYIIAARSVMAPFIVAMAVFVFFESVASRWHYLIDIPPGIMLGILCIYLSGKICGIPAPNKKEDAGADIALSHKEV